MEEIIYPCTWQYRIIGNSVEELNAVAFESIAKKFKVSSGKQSSSGKYCSINVELEVDSKEERDMIFAKLQKDTRVKFIL